VRDLLALGQDVRVMTRSPEPADLPVGVTAVSGDLTVPQSLTTAFAGVDSLFLYPILTSLPDVVQAAARAGVQRIVMFTGAWAAGLTRRDRESWTYPRYRAAEAAVMECGVPAWTILRPAPFATNLLWWAGSIRSDSVVRAPYAEGACPLIHQADIAASAVVTLTEPGHAGKSYVLTGPEVVTQAEQAATIAEAIGRPVRYEELTADQWRAAVGTTLRAGIVDDLLREWSDTAADKTSALPVQSTVADLTGKPSRSLTEWALDHAHFFR
jgi:uncharacterized protein YbjT (DUF2867 family)